MIPSGTRSASSGTTGTPSASMLVKLSGSCLIQSILIIACVAFSSMAEIYLRGFHLRCTRNKPISALYTAYRYTSIL